MTEQERSTFEYRYSISPITDSHTLELLREADKEKAALQARIVELEFLNKNMAADIEQINKLSILVHSKYLHEEPTNPAEAER